MVELSQPRHPKAQLQRQAVVIGRVLHIAAIGKHLLRNAFDKERSADVTPAGRRPGFRKKQTDRVEGRRLA